MRVILNLVCLLFFSSQLAAKQVEELPVEYFFKKAEFTGVKLSPDGKHLAVRFERDGKKLLAVMNRKTKKITASFNFTKDSDVGDFGWLNNTRVYASMVERVGPLDRPRPTGFLFAGDINGDNREQLLPASGHQATTLPYGFRIISFLPKDKNHILVDLFQQKNIAYKLNVYNSRARRLSVAPNPYTRHVADNSGNIRLAVGTDESWENYEIHKKSGDGWSLLRKVETKKQVFNPIGFTPDDSKLLVQSYGEGEGNGVYAFDLDSKRMEHVFSWQADAAPEEFIFAGKKGKEELIGVSLMPNYPIVEYVKPEHKVSIALRSLQNYFKDDFVDLVNITDNGEEALFIVSSDKKPASWYLMNLKKNSLEKVIDAMPWIDTEKMASMEPFVMSARDGTEIRGYVTLPKGKKKNLPMVMVVHGGPYGVKDEWSFNPEVQFLANRGYAVLQVNYRGSGGRTLNFEYGNYRKMGAEMQNDLTDATLWAINEGIADPKRVCIYGASYGGYASMMGVVKEPDLYQCAIAYVGVYDIAIQAEDSDTAEFDAGVKFLNDAWNAYDEKFVRERSPVYHLNKLKADLMLVHGEDDPRCPIEQYEALSEALDKMNYPYESIVKDDEQHGFIDPDNVKELYTKMDRFLEKHIGD